MQQQQGSTAIMPSVELGQRQRIMHITQQPPIMLTLMPNLIIMTLWRQLQISGQQV